MKINLLEGGAKKQKKSFQRKSSSIFSSFLASRVNERVSWGEGFIRFSCLFISWLIETVTFVVKVTDAMIVFYFTCVIWCIYISFLGRWILEVPSKLCLTMRVTFKFLSRPFCSHLKKRPIYITHSSRFLREPYFVGPRFSLLVKVTGFLDLWGFGPLGLSPFHWFK